MGSSTKRDTLCLESREATRRPILDTFGTVGGRLISSKSEKQTDLTLDIILLQSVMFERVAVIISSLFLSQLTHFLCYTTFFNL